MHEALNLIPALKTKTVSTTKTLLVKIIDWVGGMAQIVEHLPDKHEVPSSNPSIEKKICKLMLTYEYIT
jgi:hypothetical protein